VIVKKILMDRLSEGRREGSDPVGGRAARSVRHQRRLAGFPDHQSNVDQKKDAGAPGRGEKEMIQNHAEIIREAGLNPVIIDVDSFAIQNCVEANYDLRPTRSSPWSTSEPRSRT